MRFRVDTRGVKLEVVFIWQWMWDAYYIIRLLDYPRIIVWLIIEIVTMDVIREPP